MNENLVPAVDPTAIPGPVWLFHVLIVATFFLHALFMNLALGGTLLAAWSWLRAEDPSEYRAVLARRLMGINTYGISLAITTGIAPLLFVQVLYQQYFYTATILIASVWLSFLVLLTIGYYAAYAYKAKSVDDARKGGTGWLALSATLFLLIAMIHVAVNLIHSQPGRWAELSVNPWSILGDPAYVPRLLHFLLAAMGFSALIATWWAVRQASAGKDVELNTRIARFAWKWVLWTTVLQFVDGFVLLFALPRDVLLELMRGGAATMVPLALSILLAMGLLMMLSRASNPVEKPGLVAGTLGTMLLVIAIMSVTRHQVRRAYLSGFTSQYTLAEAPQWANILLFGLLVVAGLATVGYMVRSVLTNTASGDEAA